MRRPVWLSEAPLAACCALAFCIPFPFIWATSCIWLLIICWLFGGHHLTTLRRYGTNIFCWLWFIYFGLHAVSYWFSIDKEQSLFDTVSKLSFVLLPLLIGAGTPITLRGMGAILISFIAGMLGAEVFCLWQAWQLWQADHQTNHFFYHELTRGLDANAVYMAWYVGGSLTGLLLYPWREQNMQWMLYVRWLIVIFFSGFLVLLASRLMLVVYPLIIIPTFGFWLFRRYRLWIIVPLITIGLGLSSLYILGRTNNPIHKRFADIMHPDMSTVLRQDYAGQEPHWTNLTLRLVVWRVAMENMVVHRLWWRGTGNGDAYIYQNARFAGHGIPDIYVNSPQRSTLYKVNMHNMYIQSLLMLGLPGMLIFFILAVGPLFFLRRAGVLGWFFAVFHLIAILFFLQESALQTQAGVVYYCFFTSVFWAAVKRGEKGGRINDYQKVIQ